MVVLQPWWKNGSNCLVYSNQTVSVSVMSCLLMMKRTLRRSSSLYFHASFKEKKIRPLENFERFKFWMQKINRASKI